MDMKYFNKAAAVAQLAKNIKYSINNTGACKRNTSFQKKKRSMKIQGQGLEVQLTIIIPNLLI